MKEKTSSNGNLHFGHFKARVQNSSVLMMHYILSEIPFRTGYTYNRWKKATNVMLLKSEGNYDVKELRTIVLYTADFNHNKKYYGRQLMNHTIPNHRISPEQYSVPGKKSIDHALNRRLIFDISRYQKTSLSMTSCDLKSCYDRVVYFSAILACI